MFDGSPQEPVHDAVRIDETVRRAETPAQYVVAAQLRNQAQDVVGLKQFGVHQPQRHLALVVGAQGVEVPWFGGHKQIALAAITRRMARHLLEILKKRNRVERHAYVRFGGELGAHAAHALARRAFSGVRFALQDHDVAAAALGQMPGNTASHDPRPNDDHVRRRHVPVPQAHIGRVPLAPLYTL